MGTTMIRCLVRTLGILVLALGLVVLNYDVSKILDAHALHVTKSGDLWHAVHSTSLQLLQAGIDVTAVGYAAGHTPNPTYEEVCSGRTGHNEVVLVVYDPKKISYEQLLKTFFESHDPTQGMRQGNDAGTQYRSGIYVTTPAQRAAAEAAKASYGKALAGKGFGPVTTEI